MNHMNNIMMLLVVMLALLAGCRHEVSRYDSRLENADSLLCLNPDSALSLLSGLDARSLRSEGDRAYYALLLTQARYRCYVTATSDSLINTALDYYEHHADELEKLTRSYIYKGAVMEELGHPEEAMTNYKHAVTHASPNDLFNQGYARLRMGNIYRDYLVADTSDILLFKEALHYFKMVPDSFYVLSCLTSIGGSYIKNHNNDSAMVYLEQALALAKQLHKTQQEYTILKYIADIKMYSHDAHDIEDAKRIALSLLNNKEYSQAKRKHQLMVAAFTLAKQGKADSANFYLKQVDSEGLSPALMVFYDKCCAELAIGRGDIRDYRIHFEHADNLADSLVTNDMQQRLKDVETKYDNEALKYQALRYRTNWIMSLLGTALVISILVIATMAFMRKLAQRKRQLQESGDTIERLRNDTARLSSMLNANQVMSDELKDAIRNQIAVFSRLVEQHTTHFAHSPKKFAELFEQTYRMSKPDRSFWAGIRSYANSQYNDIINRTREDYPSLIDSDFNFLSLYCCDLPTTVIMACMGYKEAHSVYNKKLRLSKTLGYPNDLDSYIQNFKKTDAC